MNRLWRIHMHRVVASSKKNPFSCEDTALLGNCGRIVAVTGLVESDVLMVAIAMS